MPRPRRRLVEPQRPSGGLRAGRARRVPALRLLLLLIAGVVAPAHAQDGGTQPPPAGAEAAAAPAGPRAAFETAVATLRTFVGAMGRDDRDRALECLDLSLVEKDGAPDRARELYRCINRIESLDFEGDATLVAAASIAAGATSWQYFPRDLPSTAGLYGRDRQRALDKRERFRRVQAAAPDARIVLARRTDGEWRFSAETVRDARAFLEKLEQAGIGPLAELRTKERLTISEKIEGLWPDAFVRNTFLTVKYWQWTTLLALIFAGVVLDFVTRIVLIVFSRRIIAARGGRAAPATLRRTVRPFGLAAAALLWLYGIRLLGLPDEALRVLVPAVKLFAMLAMVWSAFRVTDLLAEVAASKATRTDTKLDDLLIPLARKAIKIFIAVFGLIYIAGALDIGIAPLMAGLGIGGAGFAFAAKDTLEHFFGSVTVVADRPFEVGDWVQIGDVEGIVEELGFRSTRVRTFYNSLVTIPNGNLVRAVVDNFGRRKYRRYRTHLSVTYDTEPDRIEAFCEGIREIIRLHPYTRKDYYQVWLHQFGPHSLDVLVYMFFETPDWNTELRERHRFMLDVIRLADRLGVSFAFPTQTLHLHREDEAADGHEPVETPDADAERRAQLTGRRAVRAVTANAGWRKDRPGPCVIETDAQSAALDDDGGGDTQIESKVGGSA